MYVSVALPVGIGVCLCLQYGLAELNVTVRA